jgi:hypothetical protein
VRTRKRGPAQNLRTVIDCLPEETRRAMLEGIRDEEAIVAGAYTVKDGGICPMLAAHRRGGRTSFSSFAHAWDRFVGAERGSARGATGRELRALAAMLEASLLEDERRGGPSEIAVALEDHQRLMRARFEREAREDGAGAARALLREAGGSAAVEAPEEHAPERPLQPA